MEQKKQRTPPEAVRRILQAVEKHKFVLLVLLAGLVIMLWPSSGGGGVPAGEEAAAEPDELFFSLEREEEKIAAVLSQIEGAGDVTVLLSLKTSLEQEVAVDEDSSGKRETVTVSTGSGTQSEVTIRYIYPEYKGALIVSGGADDPAIRLQITQAVASLTGLGADRITVTKMETVPNN